MQKTLQDRPKELQEEAEHLLEAASFLIVSAERKLELARQLKRMNRTGETNGGLTPPPGSGHASPQAGWGTHNR